jgi:transcriptional regulator with XRE-family HTH domain
MAKKKQKSRGEMSEAERLAARRRDKRNIVLRATGKPLRVFPHEFEQAHAKLVDLHTRGMAFAMMSKQVNGKIARHTFGAIVGGRRETMDRETYNAAMSLRFVDPSPGDPHNGASLDATGCARRIEALRALAFPERWLAEYGGLSAPQNIRWGRVRNRVHRHNRDQVYELYEKLKDRTPSELGVSARSEEIARAVAEKHGFAPPHCWDEDTIDDPAAVPEWTGACGTPEGYTIHLRERIKPCQPCVDSTKTEERTGGQFSPTKLRILMERRGFVSASLAAATDASDDSVRRWMGGERRPKGHFLSAICTALDCTVSDLLDLDGEVVYHDDEFNRHALRAVLDQRGRSILSLANEIGVSNMAVTYWLSGRNTPKIPKIVKAAEVLGVDWQEFYR